MSYLTPITKNVGCHENKLTPCSNDFKVIIPAIPNSKVFANTLMPMANLVISTFVARTVSVSIS